MPTVTTISTTRKQIICPKSTMSCRRLRTMVDKYPGNRVLIGETYLPNVQELDKWYGGMKGDELHLPMDMQVGFTNKLDASLFRQRINDAETMIGGNQPLLVFDNHDNIRSWERYGDRHARCGHRKTAGNNSLDQRARQPLMYYGEEIGMMTTPPTRKEDVKDPDRNHRLAEGKRSRRRAHADAMGAIRRMLDSAQLAQHGCRSPPTAQPKTSRRKKATRTLSSTGISN